MMSEIFENCIGFQWDKGNSEKNLIAHLVLRLECEQVFFNKPIIVSESGTSIQIEKRCCLLGRTDLDRFLFVVFTIRHNLIRIISARDMRKKEKFIMRKLKKIPKFKNEDAERKFWAKADSTEYVDWKKSETVVFPNLKPSTKTISIRLPESMIEEIKALANKRDVPYQSLIKIILKERIDSEFRSNL